MYIPSCTYKFRSIFQSGEEQQNHCRHSLLSLETLRALDTMLEAMVLSSPASRVEEILHDVFEFWPVKRVGITGLFLTPGRRDCPLLGEWSPAQYHADNVLLGGCLIPLGKHWGWHQALLVYSGCRGWQMPCKRMGLGPLSQACKGLLEQEPPRLSSMSEEALRDHASLAQEWSHTASAEEGVCSLSSAAVLFSQVLVDFTN